MLQNKTFEREFYEYAYLLINTKHRALCSLINYFLLYRPSLSLSEIFWDVLGSDNDRAH